MGGWHLSTWVLMGSALWVLGCCQPITAQVVSDTTLPTGEQSQVSGNPNFQIDGGVRRGGNLFHSFSQFSVLTGGSAFFNNTADVQNILTRVTGGSISNIDGLIRANGTANLFLVNPNGILFGRNASLNIGGSFVATTANAIGFPNGELFSSDATQPLPSQLLTVNPNALFFNQQNPQPITIQSRLNQLDPQTITIESVYREVIFTPSRLNTTGLHVPSGQNLLLVGGPIQLDSEGSVSPPTPTRLFTFVVPTSGGWLVSPGSYVELGAVGGVGTVGLSTACPDWQLTIPNGVPRADISLRNGSGIDVTGASGSIRLLAQTIDLSKSLLLMGIPNDVQFPNAQTGELELDATGAITMNRSGLASRLSRQGTTDNINLTAGDQVVLDGALISNGLQPTGVGSVGDINITTGALSFTNNTTLRSYTSGWGNAGNVNIDARDTVSFNRAHAGNSVRAIGTGNAGEINITAGSSISFIRGASLRSISEGRGNVGSINIHAREHVLFDDSYVYNNVQLTGVGNAGDINITAGSFLLRNDQISSFTNSRGNAGNINITARDTVAFTQAASLDSIADAPANSGSVTIRAGDSVSLDGGSSISTILTGTRSSTPGRAGDINITTRSFSLTNGSFLSSFTAGRGDAGNVTINARDHVIIDGESELIYGLLRFTSRISTQVRSSVSGSPVVGQGGDVTITTGSLFLTNGGAINTSTAAQGNAGRVTIHARDLVQISGTAPTLTDVRSGVTTSAIAESVGNGGDVIITTGSLAIADQGRINTNAQAQGNAGNIQIRASDGVSLDGTEVTSTLDPGAVGRGGNIEIAARSLSLVNGAQLSASTAGEGTAGNITVSADSVGLSRGGQLLTTTSSSGHAGDITVHTPDLQLSGATSGLFAETTSSADAGDLTIQPRGNGQSVRVNLQDGAQISASTSGSGRGGTLMIIAPDSITLTGNGSVIAAETGGSGTGGNLNLQTGTLNIQNGAEVTVSSSGTGSAGSLFVDAEERIFLDNQGRIRADTTGGGGNINLRSPLILLRNGSNITTNARGSNIPGGNIAIDTRFLIAVPSEDSNISANSENFRGGNVSINAFSLFGIQPSPRLTPLSDITASGATDSLIGTLDVTTAGIDPTSGLVALPTDFVDSSQLITQGCPANQGNSFVVTGRGGLPPTPEQQLDDDAEWQDRRRLTVAQATPDPTSYTPTAYPPFPKSRPPIIEAAGWQTTPTGKVILVATTDSAVHNPLNQTVACQGRQ